MRVFVTGATGVLGRRLLPLLVDAGHHVVALTRRHDKDAVVAKLGATPARASLFDAAALAKAVRGCDVIVHGATAIPQGARPKAADWVDNDRIRIEGTRNLVKAAQEAGARRLVLQSVTWLAARPGGGFFDESSPVHGDTATKSAVAMEGIGAESGLDVATLRCGWYYSHDSTHVLAMRDLLAKGRLPILGNGRARLSLLHVDDAARAFATAAEMDIRGVFHVVDDAPVAVKDYLVELARIAGGPPPRRVPAWLARLAAGRAAVEFLTTDAPTRAARFKEATGWTPLHPTYREGLAQVAQAWRAAAQAT